MQMAAQALTNSRIETDTARGHGLRAAPCRGLQGDTGGAHPRFAHAAAYPIYAARAAGARKWESTAMSMSITSAGTARCCSATRPGRGRSGAAPGRAGDPLGPSHEPEVRWAELVQRLIPCAERVRFTASGTEASHLALRLARAFTGKPKVVRFVGHFTAGTIRSRPVRSRISTARYRRGFSAALVEQTILLPADDVAAAVEAISTRNDMAAMILEGSGASWGICRCRGIPLPPCALPRGSAAS